MAAASSADADAGASLDAALAKARRLELSRDAMLSSIESLKVLVSNERALARVAKRKLAAANAKLAETASVDDGMALEIEHAKRQLEERETELQQLRKDGREREEQERTLREQVATVEEERRIGEIVAREKEILQREVARLQRELENREAADLSEVRSDSTGRDNSLRDDLAEKDAVIHAVEKSWRDEQARAAALDAVVADIPALRTRLRQLEDEQQIADVVKSLTEDPVDGQSLDEKAMKKKLFELKIARSVICEKDKIVKAMRESLAGAEARELEAVLAGKMSEQHAKGAEKALVEAKSALRDVQLQLENERQACAEQGAKTKSAEDNLLKAEERLSVLSLKAKEHGDEAKGRAKENSSSEEKARLAEQNLVKAREELSSLAAKVRQYEEEQKQQNELRDTAEEHRQISQARHDEIVADAKNLKSALDASEKEVARLENILARRARHMDDIGTSSPCSTDPGTEEQRAVPAVTESESRDKLNELEEVAKLAKSSYEQKCLEAHALASSVSENTTTIVTLNRALLFSKKSCDEKHAQLERSMGKANFLDKSVRKLKAALSSRVEECDFLENRIKSELEPSLLKANSLLDQRLSELKVTHDEYELHKEMSNKTRVALEQEVGGLSERLQDALTVLSGTQSRLTQSEQRGAGLEDQIAALTQEKIENLKTIEELTSQCEHRRQALGVLQERLAEVGQSVAEHEQAALDANRRTEELMKVLARAHDRQAVAEQRASRKDALVEEMEERTHELERNHSSVRTHLTEKTYLLEAKELEVEELNEVVDVREAALENQAQIACNREALFESLSAELRGVIISYDRDLKMLQEELQTVERRAKSLTDELAQVNSTLARTEHDLVQSKHQHSDSVAENKRHQAKVIELQDEMSRLRAEYRAAQEELVLRDRQISGQLLSITEKGGKIAGLRAEKAELEKLAGAVRAQLASERSRSEAHAAEVERLEDVLAKVSSGLVNSEEELSMKNTETETLSSRLASAQADVIRLENIVSDKDEEIKSNTKVVKTFEIALERSKQQLRVLESHLNGHDSLLKDSREKEEALVVKCGELGQANDYIVQVERTVETLREQLTARVAEVESWSSKAVSFERTKEALEKELATAQVARAAADDILNSTASSLAALEKSTTEEIEDLKATISSLQKVLEEKESSLSSASEVISQSSVQERLSKVQLIDSRTRGDRLFERLAATEYELASKKESLTVLETRFSELQEKLKARDNEVERLERNLVDRNQALTLARSRVDELGAKTSSIAKGELLTMQTKIEAKEKAIANLHNWCCFINGKLRAAEKALSEREVDLEVSTTAFKKLEVQLQRLNESINEKESYIREIESSRAVENSELRSRIQTLHSHLEEANEEAEKTKWMMASDGDDTEGCLVALSDELRECKEKLQAKEMEVSQIQARSQSLQETVKTYERDLAASGRTVESLTLDFGRLRNEVNSKRDARDVSDKNAALDVSKVRSETGYLLVELRRAEAELAAANENTQTWQAKAEELQPLAESTMEAQRSIEMISSRLSLAEKDSRQRIDLLETQLEEARRERDAAERDCAAAMADYAAIRARLTDGRAHYSSVSTSTALCTVTFTLDGPTAPSSDVKVYVLGGDATLGNWNPARRVPMRVVGKGRNGVIRNCDVVISANTSTSYKFAAEGADGSLVWEAGENRSLELQGNIQHKSQDTWRSPL